MMRMNNNIFLKLLVTSVISLASIWPVLSLSEGYSYDDSGRLTGVTYDDNSSITYSYDSAGNIQQQSIGSNSSPNTFALVFPADGATGLPTSLPLIWKKTADPDGDPVDYQVIFCDNQAFTNCSSQTVAYTVHDTVVHACITLPISGLFILGMMFTGSRKTIFRKQFIFIVILIFISGLSACGGSGGGAASPVLPSAAADEKQLDITGLASATTYYWKVTASDGLGGLMDSTTRSFTTN